MKNLDIDIYDKDHRVIIELEYKGTIYTEEYNSASNDPQEAARTATSALIDQIMVIDNEPLYKRKDIETQIFLKLSAKGYLTKDDIAELIDYDE